MNQRAFLTCVRLTLSLVLLSATAWAETAKPPQTQKDVERLLAYFVSIGGLSQAEVQTLTDAATKAVQDAVKLQLKEGQDTLTSEELAEYAWSEIMWTAEPFVEDQIGRGNVRKASADQLQMVKPEAFKHEHKVWMQYCLRDFACTPRMISFMKAAAEAPLVAAIKLPGPDRADPQGEWAKSFHELEQCLVSEMIMHHDLPVLELTTQLLGWVTATGDLAELERVSRSAADFLDSLEEKGVAYSYSGFPIWRALIHAQAGFEYPFPPPLTDLRIIDTERARSLASEWLKSQTTLVQQHHAERLKKLSATDPALAAASKAAPPAAPASTGAVTAPANPMSLDDILTLLSIGSKTDEIIPELTKRGFSGAADAETLRKIKQAGGEVSLLLAVRKAAGGTPPQQ